MMLQLKNNTPFAAEMAIFPDEQGIDSLYLIVKASFIIGQQWTLADPQVSVTAADEYWDDIQTSSIKYASEFHTGKPATDIVMIGNAHAPNKQAVSQLDVVLQVAEKQKIVRVFGDRHWNNGQMSSPIPFTSMPMVYERAYGGQHLVDAVVDSECEQNPVGQGHIGKLKKQATNGKALPNLENPQQLINTLSDQPAPVCFALTCQHWAPNNAFAGTYDAQWLKTRAPYLPLDYNAKFLQRASADLIATPYLQGGEAVSITNMHPQGNLSFTLPVVKLQANIELNGQIQNTIFVCETLLIEPNQLILSMTYRAKFPFDKDKMKIGNISVNLQR